jgi:hypothetical protein
VSESERSAGVETDEREALTAQELAFVEALARGDTIREAAEANHLAYSTGRRWRRRPELQAAIRELARDAVQAGTLALGQGAKTAATTLRQIAAGKARAAGPRVTACRAILEIGLRVLEVEELEARVQALEASLGQGVQR